MRSLLRAAAHWRVGWAQATACLAALPTTTLAVAAATGTGHAPPGGWVAMVLSYLTATLVTGVLVFNLWEETAWAGLVQARLARRHGLVVGAVLTAVPFAGIHLPLAFAGDPAAGDVVVNVAALAVVAVVFRLLAGLILARTRGSVLAVGVMHASFNASGSLAAVDGLWQSMVALMLRSFAEK